MVHYARLGLTLSHYDARAHLVVARRVVDNLTPGWKQFGGMWLPLPHLLNFLPAQLDLIYRTGAFAVAVSMLSFILTAAQLGKLVTLAGGGALASAVAIAAFALNANVLYLQATSMTEPLYFFLAIGAVVAVTEWVIAPAAPEAPRRLRGAGRWALLACLTRYEAWFLTLALGVIIALIAAASSPSRGRPEWGATVTTLRRFGTPAVVAIGLFMVYSRIATGSFLITEGFYEPNNPARGDWRAAAEELYSHGIEIVVRPVVVKAAALAWIAALVAGVFRRRSRAVLPILALMASAGLAIYAYQQGHPFRIRYAIPTALALAACLGVGGALGRPVAAALLALVLLTARPFDRLAPMVAEATVDRPAQVARQPIGAYLRDHRNGEKILASFQSLSHFVHELSAYGFDVRDFVHEGTWLIWPAARAHPARHVRWILIEEQAEGGDQLAALRQRDAEFLRGFRFVMRGGGVALYENEKTENLHPTVFALQSRPTAELASGATRWRTGASGIARQRAAER